MNRPLVSYAWCAVAFTAILAWPALGRGDALCVGDCDGNGRVTVEENIVGVNVALGTASSAQCNAIDCNGDTQVTIDCLVRALVNALDGCPPPPPNPDVCARALPIPADFYRGVDLPTANATVDPADPPASCGCAQNGHSVWFVVPAQASGQMTVDATASDYATVLTAYGDACVDPVELACDATEPGARMSFPVTAGDTYRIAAAAACDGPGGLLRLAIDLCGDGAVSFGEQCDDGNTIDGDGCDAACAFEDLAVDQSWATIGVREGSSSHGDSDFISPGLCGGSRIELYANAPTAQEFTPTRSTLAAVDVLLWSVLSPQQHHRDLAVTVRDGSVTGPMLARTHVSVDGELQHPIWQHVAFAAPVVVTPGHTYVLQLESRSADLSWQITVPDANCAVVPRYAGGRAIVNGIARDWSLFFRTYGSADAAP